MPWQEYLVSSAIIVRTLSPTARTFAGRLAKYYLATGFLVAAERQCRSCISKQRFCAGTGLEVRFLVNGVPFHLQTLGVPIWRMRLRRPQRPARLARRLETAAEALAAIPGHLSPTPGIGTERKCIWLIDDYAHNPVKCARSIEACQPVASEGRCLVPASRVCAQRNSSVRILSGISVLSCGPRMRSG
jgi:hypothetical protein